MRTKGSLHILHVTPYYPEAWGYGGIPRVTTSVCRGLVRLGHRVTVCTTDARDALSRTETDVASQAEREGSKSAIEEAQARIRKLYSSEVVASAFERIYGELIEGSSSIEQKAG